MESAPRKRTGPILLCANKYYAPPWLTKNLFFSRLALMDCSVVKFCLCSESNSKCDGYQLGVGWGCGGVVIACLKIHAVAWLSHFNGKTHSCVETRGGGRRVRQSLVTTHH